MRAGQLVVFFISIACLTSGCTVLDNISPRAADINQQTSDAKTDNILKNIIRAANTEPFQFTDLSTTSGQGTLEVTGGSTIPFPFRGGFGVALPQQFINGTSGIRANAGNSFSVANLNTQEFYRGLQEPISTQLIFSYLAAGFDPYVLLAVLVAEIETVKDGRGEIIRNDPTVPGSFYSFYSAINSLVAAGISGERLSEANAIGPSLSARDASNPNVLAALITSTATDAPTFEEKAGRYRLVKRGSSYRFCFLKDARASLGVDRTRSVPLSYRNRAPDTQWTLILNKGDYCGASASEIALKNSGPILKLRPRSLEGVFNFLGQIVRTELGLANGIPTPLLIPRSDRPAYRLFHLKKAPFIEASITAGHRGDTYGVSIDPSGDYDGSSRVLQLLTDLLALQSSSKNLPAPNVITVLGQ